MIVHHIEYDEFGEIDTLLTYDDVDTGFVEQEDSQIEDILQSAPQEEK